MDRQLLLVFGHVGAVRALEQAGWELVQVLAALAEDRRMDHHGLLLHCERATEIVFTDELTDRPDGRIEVQPSRDDLVKYYPIVLHERDDLALVPISEIRRERQNLIGNLLAVYLDETVKGTGCRFNTLWFSPENR
jgi:hypothetical protein